MGKVDATCTTHRVIINENIYGNFIVCYSKIHADSSGFEYLFYLETTHTRESLITYTHTWQPIPDSGVSSGTRLTIAATVWDSQKLAAWNWLILQWDYIWIHGSLYLYPYTTLVLIFVLFVIHSNMQATHLLFNSHTTIATRTLK